MSALPLYPHTLWTADIAIMWSICLISPITERVFTSHSSHQMYKLYYTLCVAIHSALSIVLPSLWRRVHINSIGESSSQHSLASSKVWEDC